MFPDSGFQHHRRGRFFNLSFDSLSVVFLFSTVLRKRLQFIALVWNGTSAHGCLQQPLCDQIGKSAVRGCRVIIIFNRQAEMAGRSIFRKFDRVLTRAQELNDAERQIGKAERVGGLCANEELLQRGCVGRGHGRPSSASEEINAPHRFVRSHASYRAAAAASGRSDPVPWRW